MASACLLYGKPDRSQTAPMCGLRSHVADHLPGTREGHHALDLKTTVTATHLSLKPGSGRKCSARNSDITRAKLLWIHGVYPHIAVEEVNHVTNCS